VQQGYLLEEDVNTLVRHADAQWGSLTPGAAH